MVEKYQKNLVKLRNTKQKDAAEWEQAKLVHIKEHNASLVATSPSDKMKEKAEKNLGKEIPEA